ncbi:MAG: hypothetical protein GNW80_00755 [Asgard group archaeon]|nr:hypothetical protein [Asgard group archaeon]
MGIIFSQRTNQIKIVVGLSLICLFLFTNSKTTANGLLSVQTSAETELELLDFSTFLGGTGDEEGSMEGLVYLGATCVDSQGNVIIVGRTASDDFPVLNPYQENRSHLIDGTISKFSSNGTLLFSTYFGGFAHDWITAVDVDSMDNIVFAGTSGSYDLPLVNPYQNVSYGGSDSNAECFIGKLSADGQTLLYSTYLGGKDSDWVFGLAVDPDDRIAITGRTLSDDYPVVNAHQATIGGNVDIYVSLFSSDGQSLLFSTYLGGASGDYGQGIGFDKDGNLYVTGQIGPGDFSTAGAYQEVSGGSFDAFLAKFLPDGTLEYNSFLGGTSLDIATDLAMDTEDNIVITGYTMSKPFPTSEGVIQSEHAGGYDLFISKFNHETLMIDFSTYYGGSSVEFGLAISTDAENNILVTGQSKSSDLPITHNTSYISSLSESDTFVLRLKSDGSEILFSTLFGGEAEDLGVGIDFHHNNTCVVSGFTKSTDYPTQNAFQNSFGGDCDLFLMKINMLEVPERNGLPGFGIICSGIALFSVLVLTHVFTKRRKLL